MRAQAFRTRIRQSVALLALLAAATLLVPVSLPTGDDLDVPDDFHHIPVGYLTQGVTLTQQFVAGGQRIRDVQVQIGTYMRVNRGTLRFALDEATPAGWRTVGAADLPTADLTDNGFATVPFSSPLSVTPGQPLRLTVRGDATEAAQAVTVWMNPSYTRADAALAVDGIARQGAARVVVRYMRTEGRLGSQAGAFLARSTPLLNNFWRGVLLAAAAAFAVGFALLLVRQMPE